MKVTIMLACAAGMSTSLLVTKMQEAAQNKGIDAEIFAVSAGEAEKTIEDKQIDILLLGPQVRFMKQQFEDKLASKNIPVDVIDMADYGMMNGEKVLDSALKLIEQ